VGGWGFLCAYLLVCVSGMYGNTVFMLENPVLYLVCSHLIVCMSGVPCFLHTRHTHTHTHTHTHKHTHTALTRKPATARASTGGPSGMCACRRRACPKVFFLFSFFFGIFASCRRGILLSHFPVTLYSRYIRALTSQFCFVLRIGVWRCRIRWTRWFFFPLIY
jgi:hypothetical protein